MNRRTYLASIGGTVGAAATAGCAGFLPTGKGDEPSYPGGTLVVENEGDDTVRGSVTAVGPERSATFENAVPAGERSVERSFVTASAGDVVTLSATLGDGGDPKPFRFLPAGGDGDAPPEVARLVVENAVEASATWTATEGY
ncbi:MAG: hypothetical protein V5A23_05105 [Halobacteriales archaeon]